MASGGLRLPCACCNRELSKDFDPLPSGEALDSERAQLLERNDWHELPAAGPRRPRVRWLCAHCWSDIRDGESPEGARAPSVYVQGMEDGEDHCVVCSAALESDEGHTHRQCFEEGKSLGALDENIDCANKLGERIGASCGYFHEVLDRVPPVPALPGKLHDCKARSSHVVFANPQARERGTEIGLLLQVFAPMEADEACFTHEHMMRVGLRCASLKISIDDNGHACWSDDGVTCVLCQRDMQAEPAAEVAHGG